MRARSRLLTLTLLITSSWTVWLETLPLVVLRLMLVSPWCSVSNATSTTRASLSSIGGSWIIAASCWK